MLLTKSSFYWCAEFSLSRTCNSLICRILQIWRTAAARKFHPDHFLILYRPDLWSVFSFLWGEIEGKTTNLQYRRESGFFAFSTVFSSHRVQILRRVKVAGFSIGEVKVVETHFNIRPFDFLPLKMKFSDHDIL